MDSQSKSEHPADSAGPTVLVVDDELTVVKIAAQILLRNGYSVRMAVSGQEALDHIREQGASVSLLLTDVMMPGTTGPELAAEARQLHKNLRVL